LGIYLLPLENANWISDLQLNGDISDQPTWIVVDCQAPAVANLKYAPLSGLYSLFIGAPGFRLLKGIWPRFQDEAHLPLKNVLLLIAVRSIDAACRFLRPDIDTNQNHITDNFDPIEVPYHLGDG
jgi:hypothetical protein